MAATKNVDWTTVEEEYRAGRLSNVQISKRHGIAESLIRRRAKREGWVKDLSEKIRREVHAKLVDRDEVREGVRGVRDDREIIDQEAKKGVEVVFQHRSLIDSLRQETAAMSAELKAMRESLDDIEGALPGESSSVQKQIRSIISLPARSKVLRELAQTAAALIPLERDAFNLDEKKQDDGSTVKIIFDSPPPASAQEWADKYGPKPAPLPPEKDGE